MSAPFSTLTAALLFAGAGFIGAAQPSTISVFAGTGLKGYSGDGGPAIQAQLNNPYGLTRGPDGALYVCDVDNHVIRRIDRSGIISTVAGSGRKGYSGDGAPAIQAELNEPYEVRFDKSGSMYFVERMNHLVRRVDAKTKIISTIAGNGHSGFAGDGGPATNASFNQPHSIQFNAAGDLFICDILNHRIRKVDMKTGLISTIGGTGEKKMAPDGSALSGSPLNGPRAIDFDREGNLWLALREGNSIYKIDASTHVMKHMAGTGKTGATGNGGPALEATLSGPKGISIAPSGNVYFTDTESHTIRVFNLQSGTVDRVAGTGQRGNQPSTNPLECPLSRPHGIFVDADGSVYIGDSENHCLRVIRSSAATRP